MNYPSASSGVINNVIPASEPESIAPPPIWIPACAGMTFTWQATGYFVPKENKWSGTAYRVVGLAHIPPDSWLCPAVSSAFGNAVFQAVPLGCQIHRRGETDT